MRRGPKPDTSFDADIRRLAFAGHTRSEICRCLNITQTRLKTAITRLDLTLLDGRGANKGSHDQARAAEMASLYKAGLTLQAIGDQYNLTRERVRQILRDHSDVTSREGGAAVVAVRRQAERATKRDQAYMAKLGCGWDEYKRIRDLGRELIKAGAAPCKSPMVAFISQRRSAGHRGIVWEMTFWQWWTIWRESGRWAQRGRGQGYVMCRKGDEGPYAVENVFIATAIENTASSKHNKSGLPIGVTFHKGGYYAHRMVRGKNLYLGRHKTPALAYAAYVAAAPPAPTNTLTFPTSSQLDA